MTQQPLAEDLKDAAAEVLAPEYHRLNKAGERQHLPSIELFVSAVTASFLVPYIKRIAEKAADATWGKFVKDEAKARSYEQLESKLPTLEAQTAVAKASPAEHATALQAAEVSLDLFLDQHGISQDVRVRLVVQMRSILETHRSSES